MNAEEIELTDKEYENILNEMYEPVSICGMNYDQGTALKKLDPIAFSCSKADYTASNERWKCTECDNEFDNKDDADECCKEVYSCKVCGIEYDNEEDALECCEEKNDEIKENLIDKV